MLHLFNKVYLEFDDRIDINFDRVVISEQFGIPMSAELDKLAYGELITYGKSVEEVLDGGHINVLIDRIAQHSKTTGKKVIIYCDSDSYVTMFAKWHKLLMPALDVAGFQKLYDMTIYKERVVTNTQLGSVSPLNMNTLWGANRDVSSFWVKEVASTFAQTSQFESWNLSLSYEYLLADYFSGSKQYLSELKVTSHMFLRRFFQEMFTDNRMMVMLNITNYRFQEVMGIDPSLVNCNAENPLDGIPQLAFYADDSIWQTKTTMNSGVYGVCELEGITQQQIDGLRNTILEVFDKYEGMQIDRNIFTQFNFMEYAVKKTITTREFDTLMSAIVDYPTDTCLIPRFDFQNVNFPWMLHIIDLKKKNNTAELSKFALV